MIIAQFEMHTMNIDTLNAKIATVLSEILTKHDAWELSQDATLNQFLDSTDAFYHRDSEANRAQFEWFIDGLVGELADLGIYAAPDGESGMYVIETIDPDAPEED